MSSDNDTDNAPSHRVTLPTELRESIEAEFPATKITESIRMAARRGVEAARADRHTQIDADQVIVRNEGEVHQHNDKIDAE